MKNCIEIKGLCKRYEGFYLDHVDLVVPGGTILGLMGENGAGKSTTIKCLLNLISADEGEIRLLGEDHLDHELELKQLIGVVLDSCYFHDGLRAADVDRILRRIYRQWDSALFREDCARFALPVEKRIHDYSRGMKTKLSLAAALAHRPKLLILDEATSGLDPVVRDEILERFKDFVADEEHGILISSHITSDLEKVADYITYLHQGKVALSGAKDDLLEQYGRLVCRRVDLEQLDSTYLAGVRTSQFGCEALVRNRTAFCRAYPQLMVNPVRLEEIMVFLGKENR